MLPLVLDGKPVLGLTVETTLLFAKEGRMELRTPVESRMLLLLPGMSYDDVGILLLFAKDGRIELMTLIGLGMPLIVVTDVTEPLLVVGKLLIPVDGRYTETELEAGALVMVTITVCFLVNNLCRVVDLSC